jgi:hypothetical protein
MSCASFRRVVVALGAALLLGAPPLAEAKNDRAALKGVKRPPAPPSATQRIPGGIDAGTSATSNSAELGLKTGPPANDAERAGMKQETAAARAAARRRGHAASQPAVAASGGAPAGAQAK